MNRPRYITSLRAFWQQSSPASRLISITVGWTLLLWILKVVLHLLSAPSSWIDVQLALPGSLYTLGHRPWTLFTYMWYHNDLGHLVVNMLLLYIFGRLFLAHLTSRQFYIVYILGGVLGGFLYPLLFSILDAVGLFYIHLPLYGSSAAILSLIVAIGGYCPKEKIRFLWVGSLSLYVVALIFVVTSLLFNLNRNVGGSIAHIGGAVWGLIFARSLRGGVDVTRPIALLCDRVASLLKGRKTTSRGGGSRRQRREKASSAQSSFDRGDSTSAPSSSVDSSPKASDGPTLEEVLDKVKRSGYSALSDEERSLLFDRPSRQDTSKV